MGKEYSHLSIWERQRLFQWYHYEKRPIREIGRLLNRSHSTISREIRRNKSTFYVPTYYPHIAQTHYEARIKERARRPFLKNLDTKNYIVEKIKLGWTPELIAGRLRRETSLSYVNHETIYQFIYKEAKELVQFLARKHKKRRKKYPRRKHKTKLNHKTSILDRPDIINQRLEIGHWESDSIESKCRKRVLNVLLERVSRLVHITNLPSKRADDTKRAIEQRLCTYPNELIKSITYDNGSENAKHLEINKTLGCDSYFCQPYHSWEKGAVEQANGLIRRFLPKGTDMSTVKTKQIRDIEHRLNNRPRKCLGYKTPIEVYNELSGALAS